MRVAIVTSTFDQRHRRRIAIYKSLLDAGHECRIYFLDLNNGAVQPPTEAVIINKYVKNQRLHKNKQEFERLKQAAIQVISDFKPQCVLCLEPESLFAGLHFKRHNNARFVYDIQEFHGHTTQSGVLRRLWVYKEERLAMKYIDCALVLSPVMLSFLQRKYRKFPSAKVLSNAMSSSEVGKYNGYLHEKAKIPCDKDIFLYHGYLAPSRGLEWIADLARQLPSNWHTVMMGWGELEGRLKELQSDRFCLIPPVKPDRLLSTISGAGMGAILYDPVNLNHINSTPNKLYEYAAAGVPVLVEDLPVLSKIVRDRKMGWVISKSDPMDEILDIFSREYDESEVKFRQNGIAFSKQEIEKNQTTDWAALIVGLN